MLAEDDEIAYAARRCKAWSTRDWSGVVGDGFATVALTAAGRAVVAAGAQ